MLTIIKYLLGGWLKRARRGAWVFRDLGISGIGDRVYLSFRRITTRNGRWEDFGSGYFYLSGGFLIPSWLLFIDDGF